MDGYKMSSKGKKRAPTPPPPRHGRNSINPKHRGVKTTHIHPASVGARGEIVEGVSWGTVALVVGALLVVGAVFLTIGLTVSYDHKPPPPPAPVTLSIDYSTTYNVASEVFCVNSTFNNLTIVSVVVNVTSPYGFNITNSTALFANETGIPLADITACGNTTNNTFPMGSIIDVTYNIDPSAYISLSALAAFLSAEGLVPIGAADVITVLNQTGSSSSSSAISSSSSYPLYIIAPPVAEFWANYIGYNDVVYHSTYAFSGSDAPYFTPFNDPVYGYVQLASVTGSGYTASLTSNLPFTANWTYALFFQPYGFPGTYTTDRYFILSGSNSTWVNGSVLISMTASQTIQIAFPSGATSNSPAFPPVLSGSRVLPFSVWSHIAATYTSQTNQLSLYINGTLDVTVSPNTVFSSTFPNTVAFGNYYPSDPNNQNLNALYGYFNAYNYSLNTGQVLQLYQTTVL